jgi:mono/diheme cytochrome c family protein
MSNETIFFIVGPLLVVAALVVAFVGLRFEKFPGSKGVLAGVAAIFATLVVATASFGWLNAADEQEHRETELAEAAATNEAEGNQAEAEEEVGSDVAGTTTSTTTTASVDGAQVFETEGCTGCHTLADAGSTATTGPALDGALSGKSKAFIEQSIVDPNKVVEEGYPPNVMPQTYGDSLSPEELDALVSYLSQVTAGKS